MYTLTHSPALVGLRGVEVVGVSGVPVSVPRYTPSSSDPPRYNLLTGDLTGELIGDLIGDSLRDPLRAPMRDPLPELGDVEG